MIQVPTYVTLFAKKLNQSKEKGKEYLLKLIVPHMLNVCNSYLDICDNDFWRLKYIQSYYDTENNPKDANWKELFLTRYNSKSRESVNFSPLSNAQKIEVLRKFKYIPFDDINKKIRHLDTQWVVPDILKALIIYNNRSHIEKSDIDIPQIIDYYNLHNLIEIGYTEHTINNIANNILQFYQDNNNNKDPDEYERMYENEIRSYVDATLEKINNQKSEVPEYVRSVNFIADYSDFKGIIFCHGKNHKSPLIPVSTNPLTSWIMVDTDIESEPNIIGSFLSWKTLIELGLGKYDYVISHACPIAGEREIFASFIRNVKWLLKPKGKLYMLHGKRIIHYDPFIADKFLDVFLDKYKYQIDIKESNKNWLVLISQ